MRQIFAIIGIWMLACSAVGGQGAAEQARLASLFVEPLQANWISERIRSKLPLATIKRVTDGLRAGLGRYQRVVPSGTGYRVEFEQGYSLATIELDTDQRIIGLWFGAQVRNVESLAQVDAQLAALPGTTAALILRNGEPLLARGAERPMPAGSTFKLAVLAALQARIRNGNGAWSDVVQLQASARSLPSGVLQTWPIGISLTVESLAAAMISVSDNTATDELIGFLGREAVERHAPARTRPFLTTREFFIISVSWLNEAGVEHASLVNLVSGTVALLARGAN